MWILKQNNLLEEQGLIKTIVLSVIWEVFDCSYEHFRQRFLSLNTSLRIWDPPSPHPCQIDRSKFILNVFSIVNLPKKKLTPIAQK